MPIYIRLGPEEPTEEHYRYWKALGRFIHFYAITERETFTLFVDKAGLTREMAKALFSGLRVRDAMNLLRRVAETRGEEVPDYVERAMTQLTHITSARDNIVHHGATLHDGAFVVTNKHKTIPRAVYEAEFPPTVIDQMTADLETVGASFYVWLCGPSGRGWDSSGVDWQVRAHAPWQYTPPPQENGRQQTRHKSQAR